MTRVSQTEQIKAQLESQPIRSNPTTQHSSSRSTTTTTTLSPLILTQSEKAASAAAAAAAALFYYTSFEGVLCVSNGIQPASQQLERHILV